MSEEIRFNWIAFYMELANKLVPFYDNRPLLVSKIKTIFEHVGLNLPKLEKGGIVYDVDPFTVFGLFNKAMPGTLIDIEKAVLGKVALDGHTAYHGLNGACSPRGRSSCRRPSVPRLLLPSASAALAAAPRYQARQRCCTCR